MSHWIEREAVGLNETLDREAVGLHESLDRERQWVYMRHWIERQWVYMRQLLSGLVWVPYQAAEEISCWHQNSTMMGAD